MSYYNQYMNNLQNKVNFCKLLEKNNNKANFNFNDIGFRNTFYNEHENKQFGGRQNLPSDYTSQQNVSIINALISLFCGIVTSVELLLNIQKKMETELSSQKDYYKLGIEIFKVLHLDRDKRMTDAKTFLDEKFSEYQKLIQASNSIRTHKNYFIDRLTPLPPELIKSTNFLNFNIFKNDTPNSVTSNELTIIPSNNISSDEEDKNIIDENFDNKKKIIKEVSMKNFKNKLNKEKKISFPLIHIKSKLNNFANSIIFSFLLFDKSFIKPLYVK